MATRKKDAGTDQRKEAPDIDITMDQLHTDERKELLDKHQGKKGGEKWFYYYESRATTQDELAAKNAEIVTEKKGGKDVPVHHKGDPLARRPQEDVDKENAISHRLSERSIEELADVESGEMTVHRSPRKARKH